MGQADRTVTLLNRLTRNNKIDIAQLLAPGCVAVCIGRDVATKPQAQFTFTFAVNLLARLYPVIQHLQVIVPAGISLTAKLPRWRADTLDEHIRLFLKALNPPVKWSIHSEGSHQRGCGLAVGPYLLRGESTLSVGSHGWSATISPYAPVEVGDQLNVVGAYAAACLGVAEVWKRLLYPHRGLFQGIPIVPLAAPLTFSTFTYRVGTSEPNPPLSSSIDIGRLTMVGLGAGGGATAFTLASMRDLQGLVNVIEPDQVVDANLNRYVFADSCDAASSRAKTDVVRSLFGGSPSLETRDFAKPFHQAASLLEREDFRYVLAAVHSRGARRNVQYETPMVLWDAGAAEDGEFRIWRMILSQTECMWCKHPSGETDPERGKAQQLSVLLGFDVDTWLRKIRDNERFSENEVASISARFSRKKVPFGLPARGQRCGDWEAKQCGRLPLPEADEEIPIPFAPVMAGVLLAGEIIKEHCFPEAVLDSYYWNTLVGRFMHRSQPHRRTPRLNCTFCHDEQYLAQYEHLWKNGKN